MSEISTNRCGSMAASAACSHFGNSAAAAAPASDEPKNRRREIGGNVIGMKHPPELNLTCPIPHTANRRIYSSKQGEFSIRSLPPPLQYLAPAGRCSPARGKTYPSRHAERGNREDRCDPVV